ncbi:MAG: dTDP-4-dehydrorhamnose reductase [Bacteroidetes bacterium]|jgi:dTDP-4-dehydrorhamnose reductase|nr:dTDP-4-dehydrorhamnose reductase [Bacteroidota bacterium]MBT6685489.1 dTDP-4-dehydrorhamnose reductase [Bacteroidota bacterium]MBT7144596.1 dTDP-4-dehydrorhamnose reductase [Bacteroidota bacterium]MBT7493486.1 dTDP-4-dehydrorhamnose reductase [Bacteroidota bacterium]
MNTILITGSKGQLGSEISELSKNYKELNFIFTDVEELDITSKKDILAFFEKNNINFVVNCAAFTAVDNAETNKEFANLLNAIAVGYLGESAKEHNAKIIHISTDYVFDGKNHTPYSENQAPKPNSAYGETKLNGEIELEKSGANSITIRTSWLYSAFGNNFVKTMMRLGKERDELGVLFDQIGTPTYAKDLAQAIIEIILQSIKNENAFKNGIYHFSNEGVCSWYDFAIEIHKLANISCFVKPIETKDYPLPANRPHYSVLNKHKIKDTFGIKIPFWRDSLIKCIEILEKV